MYIVKLFIIIFKYIFTICIHIYKCVHSRKVNMHVIDLTYGKSNSQKHLELFT